MYEGKHGRPGAAGGTGSGRRTGRGSSDRYPVPRQPGWSDDSWPDCSLDSLESLRSLEPRDELSGVSSDRLEAEDSRDDAGSPRQLRHLLGSIPVRGIRLQSPIYIERARRPAPRRSSGRSCTAVTRQEPVQWRDDTIPLVRVD